MKSVCHNSQKLLKLVGELWQPVTVIDGEGDNVCESHIVLVMYKFVLLNMCSYCILAKHQANSPSSWN